MSLSHKVPPILACGAQLKNTICLTKNNNAFISQHIGDLDNLETHRYFKQTIEHMRRILDINPEIVAHDLHPDYLSTEFAESFCKECEGKSVPVQHHHAHIVSCMAENGLTKDVIGLSLDGTGYGTDGHLWGGEVLIADPRKFIRRGHLAYVPMPGGDAAAKEPWRMAVAYLYEAFGEDMWDLDLPLMKQIDEDKLRLITEMISKKINTPLTSSLGRLFDGVAAILGLSQYNLFEGQTAIILEQAATNKIDILTETDVYNYDISQADNYILELPSLIRGVVEDVTAGSAVEDISVKFHLTVIRMFTEVCDLLKSASGLNRVALSGGVFQNRLLLEGFIKELGTRGFDVYSHHQVPSNDGGLSLGQAVAAAAVMQGKTN